ncbi:MFS transporter [Leptospira perolatii]|uniref:MFS transporter n=2 Tax=Leptospira perolatii TaxID=2023191 RepID=A0A2M9ZR90_9LEPT|nr:MFS transporter [Leptospira perolatii]PJZ74479.1 MFS transporter [Leptospira perolatii]
MLYPILPLYLSSIGYSFTWIGFLEGLAEATAGLSKGTFGKLSDVSQKRVPFIRLGYSLSAISKPMMVLFSNIGWIFLTRTIDRLGKGIRTGARDALLSEEATAKSKGKIFGLHRAMDTLGAVTGPLLALIAFRYFGLSFAQLFLIAAIPGILTIFLSSFLRESSNPKAAPSPGGSYKDFIIYWKESPPKYKRFALLLWTFSLANSSDLFLLFYVKQVLSSQDAMIYVYIFYNLVYAAFSIPAGYLSDSIGPRKILSLGFALFAVSYGGMALGDSIFHFLVLFFLYGIYAASTEGIAKAWISNLVPAKDAGTAFGTFSGGQSICLLFASIFAGWIWEFVGHPYVFLFSASVSILIAFLIWTSMRSTEFNIVEINKGDA